MLSLTSAANIHVLPGLLLCVVNIGRQFADSSALALHRKLEGGGVELLQVRKPFPPTHPHPKQQPQNRRHNSPPQPRL